MQIRRRLAIVYAFVGWHCFGVIFYFIMRKQVPEDSEEKSKFGPCRMSISNFDDANGMSIFRRGIL